MSRTCPCCVLGREAVGKHRSLHAAVRHWVLEQEAAQPWQWYLAGSLVCGSWVGFWGSLLLCTAGAGTTQKISAGPVEMIHPSQSCLSAPHFLEPLLRKDPPSPSHCWGQSSEGTGITNEPSRHQSPGGTLNSFSRTLWWPVVSSSRREWTRGVMLSTGTPVLPHSKPSRSASYRKLYCSCVRTHIRCTVWSQSRGSPGTPDHQLSSNCSTSEPGSSFTFLLWIPEHHFSLQTALLWDSNCRNPDMIIFLRFNAPSKTRSLFWRRQPRKPVD